MYEHNKIRKSLIMNYKNCPRAAWYSVRDEDYGQYNEFNLENKNLLLGQVFHKEMDSFYEGLTESILTENSESVDDLRKFFRSRFSKTKNKDCIKYFDWYSKIESERYFVLRDDGKGELLKRFIPLYIEKYVEYEKDGIIRNGHFDRMDYLGDNKVRLVEYKTGKSYDINKTYKLTNLRFELYWYKQIVENHPEFDHLIVADWMLINPTLETVYVSKFSEATERSVDKWLGECIVDINKKEEPDRNLNFYCGHCKFKKQCLLDNDDTIFDDLG